MLKTKSNPLHIDLIGVSGCGKTTVKMLLVKYFKNERITLAANSRAGMVNSDFCKRVGIKSVIFYWVDVFLTWLIFKKIFRGKKKEKIEGLLKEKFILSNVTRVDGFVTEGVFHQITASVKWSDWLVRQFVGWHYRHGRTIIVYLKVPDEQVVRRQIDRKGLDSGDLETRARTRESVRFRRELIEEFVSILDKNWKNGIVVRVVISEDDSPAGAAEKVKMALEKIPSNPIIKR